MTSKWLSATLIGAVMVSMAGCVATPPRARYYDDDYYQRRARFDCAHRCGVIRDIERVYVRDNETSGGGAVLGAIIGGMLGNTLGHGRGRTATTVAGAVAGGFAGNAIERNQNGGGGREAWRFNVRLDDGRWAAVTQWEGDDLRPGDRVMIRDNRLMLLR